MSEETSISGKERLFLRFPGDGDARFEKIRVDFREPDEVFDEKDNGKVIEKYKG